MQKLEAHDDRSQHHQHDAGGAVEGLGVGLIGKDRRNARPQQGKADAERPDVPVRCAADGKVADSSGQGREGHDEHAGTHSRFQLVAEDAGEDEEHHHAAACADEAADERAHQRQRHDLAGKTAAALFLRAAAGILIPRVLGVVLRVDRGVGVLLVALAIAVVIQVVLVFVHDDALLWTETLAGSLFAFDDAIIGHIYVYFLNAI